MKKPKQPIRVFSAEQLLKLARERRSVFSGSPHSNMHYRPLPAAWVVNMCFSMVMRMLETGLYVYEPRPISKNFRNVNKPITKD